MDVRGHSDGDNFQQPILLGARPRLSNSARNRFRRLEYGSVHWRRAGLASRIHAGANQVADHRMVYFDRWRVDQHPHLRIKSNRDAASWQAPAPERRCPNYLAAFLMLGLGR